MSTYAVFGMTAHHAEIIARKTISKKVDRGGVFVPESKFEERVKKETKAIMKGNKVVQLSTLFDTPQIAREFREIAARSESRDLHIKARVKSVENTKTGKPKLIW